MVPANAGIHRATVSHGLREAVSCFISFSDREDSGVSGPRFSPGGLHLTARPSTFPDGGRISGPAATKSRRPVRFQRNQAVDHYRNRGCGGQAAARELAVSVRRSPTEGRPPAAGSKSDCVEIEIWQIKINLGGRPTSAVGEGRAMVSSPAINQGEGGLISEGGAISLSERTLCCSSPPDTGWPPRWVHALLEAAKQREDTFEPGDRFGLAAFRGGVGCPSGQFSPGDAHDALGNPAGISGLLPCAMRKAGRSRGVGKTSVIIAAVEQDDPARARRALRRSVIQSGSTVAGAMFGAESRRLSLTRLEWSRNPTFFWKRFNPCQ